MLWWLILGVSLPELRNAERTGQYSLLLGVSEKVWLEESGMWLSGMSGRFALDVDRSYHISWRLRKKKNKRERKKFPSSWTWTFLLLLPLDFKIVAGLVLRLRIWISSPRILQHLGGAENDAISVPGSSLSALHPRAPTTHFSDSLFKDFLASRVTSANCSNERNPPCIYHWFCL